MNPRFFNKSNPKFEWMSHAFANDILYLMRSYLFARWYYISSSQHMPTTSTLWNRTLWLERIWTLCQPYQFFLSLISWRILELVRKNDYQWTVTEQCSYRHCLMLRLLAFDCCKAKWGIAIVPDSTRRFTTIPSRQVITLVLNFYRSGICRVLAGEVMF